MARQTATQKQLLTLRQAVIVLSIVVLSVFAYKYARNVMQIRATETELVSLHQAVEEVKKQQEDVDQAFIESVSPAKVDETIKRELGWVKPGDIIYVPIPSGDSSTPAQALPEAASSSTGPATEQRKPNWQLWWELIAQPDQ